jgi:hypothetical protein
MEMQSYGGISFSNTHICYIKSLFESLTFIALSSSFRIYVNILCDRLYFHLRRKAVAFETSCVYNVVCVCVVCVCVWCVCVCY